MKKGIHPENYRPVVFKDMSNGDVFFVTIQLVAQKKPSNSKVKLIRW